MTDTLFDNQIAAAQVGRDIFKPRAAIYMLHTADKPILLSTTANLKHAVGLRLGPERAPNKTDYQAITTHVSWRYVNSAFAANWWYLLTSRRFYPDQYRSLLAWHYPWFLRLDMGGPSKPPTVEVKNSVAQLDEFTFGPLTSRRAAHGLANWLLEHFDLCRYEDILRKSPHGQPCAYKEMGKCPAPCDGTIPMDTYRQTVQDAVALLTQLAPITRTASDVVDMPWYALATDRMKQAAVRMDFRSAAKIKKQLESLADQFQSALAGWGLVTQWKYITLQRGPTRRWIEPWIVLPGMCTCLPPVDAKTALADAPAFIRHVKKQLDDGLPSVVPFSQDTALLNDVFALLTYHLNRSRDPGLYFTPADMGRESEMAHRVAEWLGEPDASAVVEMASDSVLCHTHKGGLTVG